MMIQTVLYRIFVLTSLWIEFGEQIKPKAREDLITDKRNDDSSLCPVAPNVYITVYQGEKEANYSKSMSRIINYNIINEKSLKRPSQDKEKQSVRDFRDTSKTNTKNLKHAKAENVASAAGSYGEKRLPVSLQGPEGFQSYANQNLDKAVNLVENVLVDDTTRYKLNLEIFELVQKNNNILKGLKSDIDKQRRSVTENAPPDQFNQVKPIDDVMRDVLSPLDTSEDLLYNINRLGMHSFLRIMHSTGLKEKLMSKNHTCTIFAPTDQAFRRLSEKVKSELNNLKYLTKVLLFHVADGYHYTKNFGIIPIKTLNNASMIRATRLSGTISLQGSNLVSADNTASNGIIHVVDSVLLPPSQTLLELINSNPSLTTFARLVRETKIDSILNSATAYTVFAPSNEAFKDLKENIFTWVKKKLILTAKYHVFGPSALYINNFRPNTLYRLHMLGLSSSIIKVRRQYDSRELKISRDCGTTEADIIAKNGVIHIIDCVLY